MGEYNTVIIGSGIAGMSCAIYLKRANISVLVIENYMPGGQLNKAGVIENYPGYVAIDGPELAMRLLEQVDNYKVDYVYGEVLEVDYKNKIVVTDSGEYKYTNLVLATGRRERLLDLVGEEEAIGKGISLCATCDGALYKGKDVIVVGGGNTAVSEALYLANICKKVYLIYRKSELRADNVLKDRVKNSNNIEVIYNSIVESYIIDNDKVIGVCLGNNSKILASCVFLAIGRIPNSELFSGKMVDGYIVVDNNGRTSIDGVYAIGDVIKKDIYQLVTASNEGVIAACDIIERSL